MLKRVFVIVITLAAMTGYAQSNQDVKAIINYEVVSPALNNPGEIQVDSVSLLIHVDFNLQHITQVAYQFNGMPWVVRQATDTTVVDYVTLYNEYFSAKSPIIEYQQGDSVVFRYTYQNNTLTQDTTAYTLTF